MAAAKKEVPAEAPEPQDQPLDAVIIIKEVDAEGNIAARVALNGNVNALEAQTLIEFGLKSWRDQVGLTD